MPIKPKYQLLVLCLTLMLYWAASVNAQESSNRNQLVEPTSDDYLAHIDSVIASMNTAYFDGRTENMAEFDTLVDELYWRYTDHNLLTYQQLITAYHALAAAPQARTSIADDRIIPCLIEQWLVENPTYLDQIKTLQVDEFEFDVKRLNNTGAFLLAARQAPFNGENLYNVGLSGHTANYIVIPDESRKYRVPPLPSPIFGDVIMADDLNADRQQDFGYETFDHVGNNYVNGSLAIVTWTGEAFQPLANIGFRHGPPMSDYDVTWQLVQLDDDMQREIIGFQTLSDNWNCRFLQITYYDWQTDGSLISLNHENSLPDSFGCLLRQAEQHSWSGDYPAAIALYKRALAKLDGDFAFRALAQVHLGLDYLLTGNEPDARLALSTLPSPIEEDAERYPWVNAIREAYRDDPRLLPVCQSIYNQLLNMLKDYRLTGTVYVTDGGFYGAFSYDPVLDLENLSCDLRAVMQTALADVHFLMGKTPVEQLKLLGLAVGGSIDADLDQDGDQDWLVWIAGIGMDPFLFTTNSDTYTMSVLTGRGSGDVFAPSADLRLPDTVNEYRVVSLPDGSQALMNVDFGHDLYSDVICQDLCGGGPPYICADDAYAPNPARGIGDITLWRLEDGQLATFFFASLCGWGYDTDLFPDGEQGSTLLAGNTLFTSDDFFEIVPVAYQWDDDERTYILPPSFQIPPTPTFIPIPPANPVSQPPYQISDATFRDIRAAFAVKDYDHALEILNSTLAQPDAITQPLATAFHYYRAMTLEVLNQPNKALVDYEAIYETAPDTAWGILAKLHLRSA